jgi:hypothetical protein
MHISMTPGLMNLIIYYFLNDELNGTKNKSLQTLKCHAIKDARKVFVMKH